MEVSAVEVLKVRTCPVCLKWALDMERHEWYLDREGSVSALGEGEDACAQLDLLAPRDLEELPF